MDGFNRLNPLRISPGIKYFKVYLAISFFEIEFLSASKSVNIKTILENRSRCLVVKYMRVFPAIFSVKNFFKYS